MNDARLGLVRTYFRLGLRNHDILTLLALQHGIVISSRTLKRLTKRGHLYRRKHQSDILDVALFILEECKGSGQLNGYRWMHSKCIESGFVVSQDTVRLLQGILDQRGVDNRRKRRLQRRKYVCSGPNAIWHIDGYDKLKPFGICIHGAIDGFSRHLIWIQAWNTNNNPRVVAGYFVQAAMLKNGVPERIRSDCGTENGHIEKMQVLLRTGHTDRFAGEQSFMYGASTLNQRIEWWWGLLRREAIQFWMELFKSLQNDGYFTGDFLDKALVQFCFMDMIQENIDSVARIWNNHLIRTSKHSGLPSGRPFILYTVPELYSTSDHLVHVDQDLLEACAHECIKRKVHHATMMFSNYVN